MSQPILVAGSCINVGGAGHLGFDAFSANPEAGLFVLCDGANSCPGSGKAAAWLSDSLAHDPDARHGPKGFEASLRRLHLDMLVGFPETAATVVAVSANSLGLMLASVGDSYLSLLKPSLAGWGAWQWVHTMPRDIDPQGHPSQLVGSEVFVRVHSLMEPPQGRFLALLMSDGPANILSEAELLQSVRTLGRRVPSSHDLDYLCKTLAVLALQRGCQDDVSVAMVYIAYP